MAVVMVRAKHSFKTIARPDNCQRPEHSARVPECQECSPPPTGASRNAALSDPVHLGTVAPLALWHPWHFVTLVCPCGIRIEPMRDARGALPRSSRLPARPARRVRYPVGVVNADLARQALSARRDVRRRPAPTSRCSPRWPSASSCVCSTRTATKRASTCRRCTAFCWHGYLPDVQPGPALRLPRARPVGARARACGATRRSCCSIPYAKADRRARGTGTRRSSRTTSASPTDSTQRRRQRAVRAESRSSSTRSSTGATTGRRARRGTRRSSTRRTSRASRSAIPTFPRSCAAPTPGSAHPAVDRAPAERSASPRSSCCRCTSSCTTDACVERGLRNYWGYNSIGFFAPHDEYARARPARRAGAGVQADGQGAARRPASR